MTTINHVAARAGVSIKSVSRVINNEHVSDKLRERVLRAMEALDYHPNRAARGLAGSRSFLFAFVYWNPLSKYYPHYYGQIQEGAARRCREIGYHLVVETCAELAVDFPPILSGLTHGLNVDGILLVPPACDDEGILQAVAQNGIPVARISTIDRYAPRAVTIDEKAAASTAVSHLLALGHRRIGMIRSYADHLAAARRYDGYVEALMEFGIEFDASLVVEGSFSREGGMEATHKLLALPSPPTAIFSANDAMAFGVVQTAVARGLSVPKDLSVVGFDDDPGATLISPSLTTIHQPLAEMGAAAIDCLVSGSSRELNGTLIIRETTTSPLHASGRTGSTRGG
jgi:LacI family transcriptional regulator